MKFRQTGDTLCTSKRKSRMHNDVIRHKKKLRDVFETCHYEFNQVLRRNSAVISMSLNHSGICSHLFIKPSKTHCSPLSWLDL